MIYLRMFKVWLSVWGGVLFGEQYSKGWDIKLNQLLDEYPIEPHGKHCVKIDSVVVWTSNQWYSYGHPYGSKYPQRRPSIKTMIRLNDEIDRQLFK